MHVTFLRLWVVLSNPTGVKLWPNDRPSNWWAKANDVNKRRKKYNMKTKLWKMSAKANKPHEKSEEEEEAEEIYNTVNKRSKTRFYFRIAWALCVHSVRSVDSKKRNVLFPFFYSNRIEMTERKRELSAAVTISLEQHHQINDENVKKKGEK